MVCLCFFIIKLTFCINLTFYTVPRGPPTNFSVAALSSNSLHISWDPPLPEEQNGVVTHYVVTITNLNDGLEREHIVLNTSLMVYSLDPHTEYEVYVTAATAVGAGPPTVPLSAHTHEDGMSFTNYTLSPLVLLIDSAN